MFKRIVLAALAAMATSAIAADEMVFSGDGVTVRLTLSPCQIPALVAGLIEAESQIAPRAAWVKQGSVEIRGCWGLSEGKVLIGDEAGRAGFIPMEQFKPAESI